MKLKERYQNVIEHFSSHFQKAETELNHSNAFELLVAVVLSAQCTDKRVNMHTPAIFMDFPTPEILGNTDFDTLFPYIKSISFPNNKTKNLILLGQMLVKDFASEVPSEIEQLVKLPGVGRKTANVIVSVIFNKPAMAVDTHVFRVSKRLGLVNAKLKTPLEVEKVLMKNIPTKYVAEAHHWLILHGRYVCVARNPKCAECGLTTTCLYFETTQSGKDFEMVSINKKPKK